MAVRAARSPVGTATWFLAPSSVADMPDAAPSVHGQRRLEHWARRALRRPPSSVGVVVAGLFFAASVTPSLYPRPWSTQAILSGVTAAAGYGVGAGAAALVRRLIPQSSPRRSATLTTVVTDGAVRVRPAHSPPGAGSSAAGSPERPAADGHRRRHRLGRGLSPHRPQLGTSRRARRRAQPMTPRQPCRRSAGASR